MPVLELENHPGPAIEAIADQAAETVETVETVETDRAETNVLGCGGMSGLGAIITERCAVLIVDGVTAAAKLPESLVGLGLKTSKVRTYATLRKKQLSGWPFP